MRGLHTPHAIATCSTSMRPLSVTTALDRAVGDLDVEDLGVGEHLQRALGDRLLADQRAGLQRVDHRHTRRVVAAEEDVGVDERHHLLDLGRRQQPGVDAPRLGRRHPALELLEPCLVAGDLDATTRGVEAELFVLALALEREERHLLVVVGGEDEVRGVACRAPRVGEWALVEQHDLGPTQSGEVAGQAVADDAGADDHALGAGGDFSHGCLSRVSARW